MKNAISALNVHESLKFPCVIGNRGRGTRWWRQSFTCELGYVADTMFHRTYFLFTYILTYLLSLRIGPFCFVSRPEIVRGDRTWLQFFIFTFRQSRPNKAGLKCPSVNLSDRPQKSFFDFSEIRSVGKGRWVMHDGMQYDSIQGQGHEPLKVGNSAIFRCYLLPCL